MRPGRLQSPVRRHGLTANLVRGQPPVAYLYAIRDILLFERVPRGRTRLPFHGRSSANLTGRQSVLGGGVGLTTIGVPLLCEQWVL